MKDLKKLLNISEYKEGRYFLNARKLAVLATCLLIGLESVVFVYAGISEKTEVGGEDGTSQYFGMFPQTGGGFEDQPELPEVDDDVPPGDDQNSDDQNNDDQAGGDKNGDDQDDDGNGENEEPNDPSIEERKAAELARDEAEEKGLLILVNKQNSVDENYKPDDLTSIIYYAEDRSKGTRYMRKEAAEHFHQLVEGAAEEGCTLVMTTAYRSYGFQQILWNNYVAAEGEEAASRFSARPGQSEHQTGLAVDVASPSVDYKLTVSFGETAEGMWLAENAHNYGFIIRFPKGKEDITGYQYEPWHIRYVGKDIASLMYKEGLTLEEYLEWINN